MIHKRPLDPNRDLEIRRFIPATPTVLFEAWTRADLLVKWWGPPGVTCTEAEIDLRVGGTYRIANQLPDGAMIWIHGKFETVDPPSLLRYSWGIGTGGDANETVTVRFKPVNGGTELVLRHEGAPDRETRFSHENGWDGCLAGLGRFVSTLTT
jgi:uncharacterized protein YndB with AHSA1/START domain